MNYERLLVLVCVAALSAGSTLAALILLPVQAGLQRAFARRRSKMRARLVVALWAAPLVTGIFTAIGVGFAFLRHEPRQTTEQAGAVLLAVAGWTMVLALLAAWRLSAAAWQTSRCHRLVGRYGRRIDVPEFPLPVWRISVGFPVAAVSGVLNPRLILSTRVLDECSRDELLTILRHERAHIRRRDNLVRACLLALPDLFRVLKRSERFEKQWHDAVEEAADDEAVAGEAEARVTLAAALVRVGRMATERPPAWMPALALFHGDDLERRVCRLLDPQAPPTRLEPRQRVTGAALCLLTVGTVAWVTTGPRALYTLLEWAVRNLP